MLFQKTWFLPLTIAILLLAIAWPYRDLPVQWTAGLKSAGPLAAVKTWHYQLDNIDVEKLAMIPADLMVIDYAKKDGKVALTPADVARIKAGPDGRGRYVVAYLSVGESEEFRYYWQDDWKSSPPDWVGEENCAWPKAHRVRYWLPGWKAINFAGADSYLKRIIAAGFDGVYLDRVDIYETFEAERPRARAEMIEHVEQLAHTAWRLKPGFFVIPQNAEALLENARYRSAIDGLGKESLFHGLSATAKRNKPEEISWSSSHLAKLQFEGKPVFVVEYLIDADHITASARELRAHGLVPTYPTRALDGGDPTAPLVLNSEVGTPERTAKACPPGSSW
ncbi:MAG: MJ1477/TM1410 family putative glycoside hydrolase [Hyphomicrobium sp.]